MEELVFLIIRPLDESDFIPIISVVDEWWAGRQMTDKLPKLFFTHFNDTSFIIEVDGEIVAFLIGFVSQSYSNEAYIHFVGVHPDYRKQGLGRKLYESFFDKVTAKGCNIVRSITSPVNKGSICFHTSMGFQIVEGGSLVNGISINTNYDGFGKDRVLFFSVKSTSLQQ